MKRILISGYYGFGNSGDDALLLSIISEFKKKGMGDLITVLSANPEETKRIYGVRAINRINPFSVLFSIIGCRMFISGGGTLLQDGTSTKSLLYYIYLIKLALLFRKKVMLYANGIGPVRKEKNVKMCKSVLNKVHVITLRDKKSLDLLSEWGIVKPEIKLTADPVFLVGSEGDVSDITANIEGDFICVSVRRASDADNDFSKKVSAVLDRLRKKHGVKAVLLPLQATDKEICDEIAHRIDAICVKRRLSPGEIMSLVSKSRICIGMRLHMLIYAAAMAVPIVGIVYDPKVSGFMEYAGQTLYTDVRGLNEDTLFDLADKCITESAAIKEELVSVKKRLGLLAEENSEMAVRLYNRSLRSE